MTNSSEKVLPLKVLSGVLSLSSVSTCYVMLVLLCGSFVVFNILRFSLNRFFTLIAFDKKENAVPMQAV